MSAKTILASAVTLAVGYAVAGALYWALLNVPESNVAALTLSALLAALAIVVVGVTTALATLSTHEPWRVAVRRSATALPAFLLGLVVCAVVFALAGAIEHWWAQRHGEVEAMLLPYIHTASTEPLRAAVRWLIWLLRWGIGLSLVLGLLVAAASGMTRRGVRLAVRRVPLAASAVGALVISEGLGRIAYWRPSRLPASWLELAFASVKLAILYALCACIAAIVVQIYRRTLLEHP